MSTYVSDWSQEVYGDVRNWAVPGVDTATRRDSLNDYLQHVLVLASAGPPTIDTARSFLQTAFSPLANAAWERDTAYGWTMVPAAQMASYVSAEVYALRYFSSAMGQATDHWGFAWAPRNGSGLSASEFAAQTGQILDRLAAAIHDSGQTVDPEDPGSAACGLPNQNLCVGDVDGARLNAAWQTFRAWTQPVLTFATPPQTIPAGTPSAAMHLTLLSSSGQPQANPSPLTVTLGSSSANGTFSTSPSGPWSPTLTLTIPAGTGTSPDFYYLDTRAGSALVTASATGATSGTQTETITPGPLAGVAVNPEVRDPQHAEVGSADRGRQGHVREHAARVGVLVACAAGRGEALAEDGTDDHAHHLARDRRSLGHRHRRDALCHRRRAHQPRPTAYPFDHVPAPLGRRARHLERRRRCRPAHLPHRHLRPRPARTAPHLHRARDHRRCGEGDVPGAGASPRLLRDDDSGGLGPRLHLGSTHTSESLLPTVETPSPRGKPLRSADFENFVRLFAAARPKRAWRTTWSPGLPYTARRGVRRHAEIAPASCAPRPGARSTVQPTVNRHTVATSASA